MRVLMLNNEYPPLGGGTGTVNEALLREFASEPGIEIDLVTSSEDNSFSRDLLFDRFRIFRLPVSRFDIHHASNKELILYAWRAFRFARRLHREVPYDICMAWSTVPAGAAALALQRACGLPYLVRVMGPDIPGFEQRYARLYPFLSPVIRRIWRGSRTVVAKCRHEEELIHAVAADVPVVLIPNGVDAQRFQVERPDYDGPLRILCVGRLIERKGQRDLIEALRRLRAQGFDFRCRLVGSGDSEGTYRRLVAEAGLKDVVEFSGYVPREKMPQVYAEADVFVLPSYNEGMSVAALEAMAAALLLLLSRTGGTEDLVKEGVNGWTFEVGDALGLSRILAQLIQMAQTGLLELMRPNDRANRFPWLSVKDKYVQLLTRHAGET